MIAGHFTVKINFSGGIASPGELLKILSVAKACEITQVRFGLRQQMIMHVSFAFEKPFIEKMAKANITYYLDNNPHPNIISSYVSEEVFQQGNWLREGVYKDILGDFDHKPQVKINISDSQQSFTPFFSGHINFISSEEPNFWYLYIRLPKSNKLIIHNQLIFSNEIASLSVALEERIYSDNFTLEELPNIITRPLGKELNLPHFTLPYYEGFNRYGKKSWLGIYRRKEVFKVSFLESLCKLCLDTKIGEICLTPWKSIIIKNIQEEDRKNWSVLLAKHDINVRHAANELNWQIEDDSLEAIRLKNRLVRYFNKTDLRTFGICLGVKTVPKTEVYASIMVRQRQWKYFPLFNIYDITHTTDYDPNGREVSFFAKNILGFQLSEKLRKAVLKFNEQKTLENQKVLDEKPPEPKKKVATRYQYQCSSCFTIYDSAFGDTLNNIPPGLSFLSLPKDYTCSICDAPKSSFKLKEVEDYLI